MEAEYSRGLSSEEGDGRTFVATASQIATDTSKYLKRLADGVEQRYSLGLGHSVDKETYGAESENLVILAGETKGGKTLSAINLVASNTRLGVSTLVVTTEVSSTAYMLRLVARATKIPLSKMRDGLSEADRERVESALSVYKRLPLFIADKPLCKVDDIEHAVLEVGPEIVVIDHLQRIQYSGENPALGFKQVVLRLKNLAVTLGIPVVVLSQVTFAEGWWDGEDGYLTDRMGTRWSREPIMEADKVLVLHNKGLHRPDMKGEANLIVHSMRDYSSGEVIPMKIKPEHQFLGDYDQYRREYPIDGSREAEVVQRDISVEEEIERFGYGEGRP